MGGEPPGNHLLTELDSISSICGSNVSFSICNLDFTVMTPRRKVVCIIQARMGSTRLPGKSLMPLGGKPLIQNVIERICLAKSLDGVVLATTIKSEDDAIVSLGQELNVSVFRGHSTDLVDRYFQAAKKHKADVVVRIPADNPLIHPEEIDRIVNYFLRSEMDFASNICAYLDNEYPDGLGAEVFSIEKLEEIHLEVLDPRHREHVTTFFRENPDRFRLGTVKCPKEFRRPDIVLDINTKSDYEFIARLFDDLGAEKRLITILDIIPWYDSTELRR